MTRSGDDEETSVWRIRASLPGIYNSTWTDMFIETTCDWGMNGPTGAIWVATDYHQMVKWALSFALSGEESQSVRSLSNTEQVSHHTRHREEAVIGKKLKVGSRQTKLTTRACATHLMFALTHLNMPLTQMVHSWTLSPGKSRTLMAMQHWTSGNGKLQVWVAVGLLVLLPSRQASCHNGFEEEPLVSWQGTCLWPGTHLRMCHWSTGMLTRDQLQWCVGLWVSCISTFDVQCRWEMNVATSKSTLKHKLQAIVSEHNCPISDTIIMMCLPFPGLSPGRLANCVYTWTPLRRSSIKLYDARAYVILVFDRYSRPSRGRRDQDQVASINW